MADTQARQIHQQPIVTPTSNSKWKEIDGPRNATRKHRWPNRPRFWHLRLQPQPCCRPVSCATRKKRGWIHIPALKESIKQDFLLISPINPRNRVQRIHDYSVADPSPHIPQMLARLGLRDCWGDPLSWEKLKVQTHDECEEISRARLGVSEEKTFLRYCATDIASRRISPSRSEIRRRWVSEWVVPCCIIGSYPSYNWCAMFLMGLMPPTLLLLSIVHHFHSHTRLSPKFSF